MKIYLVLAQSVFGLLVLLGLIKFSFDRIEKRFSRSSRPKDGKKNGARRRGSSRALLLGSVSPRQRLRPRSPPCDRRKLTWQSGSRERSKNPNRRFPQVKRSGDISTVMDFPMQVP